MNRQVVSALDTLNGFLLGPETRLWFWALGQLLVGRLKVMDDKETVKTWPSFPLNTRGCEDDQIAWRFGHLHRCLLSQTFGKESLFLLSFFLEKKWALDFPRLGNFSLFSPRDLDFFGGVDVSEFSTFLDKVGFRSLEVRESNSEILRSLKLRQGSYLFLIAGELFSLEVDYYDHYSWCFLDQKIREIHGDDQIIVIAK